MDEHALEIHKTETKQTLKTAFGGIAPPQTWAEPLSHLKAVIEHPWYSHLAVLQDVFCNASHDFFRKERARHLFLPLTSGCVSSPMGLGSDSLPVNASINGRDVYLSDSMQFMLELGIRMSGASNYYLMPSFRGEEQDSRHLNQFFHAEVENHGGLNETMAMAERYIRALLVALRTDGAVEIEAMTGSLFAIEQAMDSRTGAFPKISFTQAYDEFNHVPGAFEKRDGSFCITPLGEQLVIEKFGDFVWLMGMPKSTVPFYQASSVDEEGITLTADLLAGIGEILGAGERAKTHDEVLSNLNHCGVDPENYRWYLEMKEHWPLQTTGFGLGIERFLMWATGAQDIRDMALIPRDEYGHGYP